MYMFKPSAVDSIMPQMVLKLPFPTPALFPVFRELLDEGDDIGAQGGY